MSIDYDRLREVVDATTPGPWERHPEMPNALVNLDTKFLVHHEVVKSRGMEPSAEDVANTELIALAPDMARELLRLRDEVERAVSTAKRQIVLTINTGHVEENGPTCPALADLTDLTNALTDLLNGDTE